MDDRLPPGFSFGSPPDAVTHDGITLRRWTPELAPAMVAAVTESLDHLRPWMPWAQEPPTLDAQLTRAREASEAFDAGRDFAYAITPAGRTDTILGSCGLHGRQGPHTLEIGYWVHPAHVRQGIATKVVHALTKIARAMDVPRVEIRCDEANTASAAVAAKASFSLETVIALDRPPRTPAETCREMVWVAPVA